MNRTNNGFKITPEEYIKRCQAIHGRRYDYSLCEYVNSRTTVRIICRLHGSFEQIADYHRQGNGCPKCIGRNMVKEDFVLEARKVHGIKYDYSCGFKNKTTKMKIICADHGLFIQKPNEHLLGKGCPQCGVKSQTNTRTKTKEQFLKEAKLIHGERYSYDNLLYSTALTRAIIICKEHGQFLQTPASHLRGSGCKKCSHRVSKGEKEWLDYLCVPERQYRVIFPDEQTVIELDGYDPKSNTIYEYYGDYWHGNLDRFDPDKTNPHTKITFQELNDRTMTREIRIKNNGYNLVTIWETDWIKLRKDLGYIKALR